MRTTMMMTTTTAFTSHTSKITLISQVIRAYSPTPLIMIRPNTLTTVPALNMTVPQEWFPTRLTV